MSGLRGHLEAGEAVACWRSLTQLAAAALAHAGQPRPPGPAPEVGPFGLGATPTSPNPAEEGTGADESPDTGLGPAGRGGRRTLDQARADVLHDVLLDALDRLNGVAPSRGPDCHQSAPGPDAESAAGGACPGQARTGVRPLRAQR